MAFEASRFKKVRFPHPMIVHWILNPGLAINELVLGQRVPKLMLMEKGLKSFLSTQYWVPCPACSEIHDGRLWSGEYAFGHWFGCVCPACGEKIPTLFNLTSLVCLLPLLPLTMLIPRRWREKYIAAERERTRRAWISLRSKK